MNIFEDSKLANGFVKVLKTLVPTAIVVSVSYPFVWSYTQSHNAYQNIVIDLVYGLIVAGLAYSTYYAINVEVKTSLKFRLIRIATGFLLLYLINWMFYIK